MRPFERVVSAVGGRTAEFTTSRERVAQGWPVLCWIAAAGGTLAVLALGIAGRRHALYVDDGAIALNILAGKGFVLAFHGPEGPTAAHAPFQPFVLAAVHKVLGIGELGVLGVVMLRAIAHGAVALCAYPIARRIVGQRAATLLSALIAFHPLLVVLAGNTGHMDDRLTLALPLILLAIWACAVARERPGVGWALLAGAAIGFASLSEPPLTMFGLIASLVIAAVAPGWRERARRIAAVLLGVALVIAPWIARNALVFRHFVPIRSSFGLLLWVGNNPEATGLWEDQEIMNDPDRVPARQGELEVGGHATSFNFFPRDTLQPSMLGQLARVNEVERDRILQPEAVAYIWTHPGRFLKLTLRRSIDLMAAPPLSGHLEGEQFVGRTIAPLSDWFARWWDVHADAATRIGWTGLRLYLLLTFVGAVGGALWVGTPLTLLLGTVPCIWLLVFSVTHCGYAVYRVSLEPFVILCVGAAAAKATSSWTTSPICNNVEPTRTKDASR